MLAVCMMGPMCDAYRAQVLRVGVLRAPTARALVAMLSLGPVFNETSAVRGPYRVNLKPMLADAYRGASVESESLVSLLLRSKLATGSTATPCLADRPAASRSGWHESHDSPDSQPEAHWQAPSQAGDFLWL